MLMNRPTKIFCVSVIVADLFAIVYFGGHYLTTGYLIPHGHSEPQILLGEADHDVPKAVAKKEPEPEVLPSGFVPDVAKGMALSATCKTCHSFDAGGANKVGPNLWGIMGAKHAHLDSFTYSSIFQEMHDVVWTEENMDAFLKKPRTYAPGTKMAYAGMRKIEDRAHLIAWMKTLK